MEKIDPEQFSQRKAEFELDWQRRLSYLVPAQNMVDFEDAWQTSADLLSRLTNQSWLSLAR